MAARLPRPAPPRSRLRLVLGLCWFGLAAWLGLEFARLPGADELKKLATAQVRETATMRTRLREAAEKQRKLRIRQQWVELEQVSRPALTAILTSEDARFFEHGAVDLRELEASVQDTLGEGKPLRGASTLTQQVVKNLYLSEDRSFLRKAKEAWLAHRLEGALSKKRILRLYVNVAEWGDGIFGLEAAAQTYLKKRAADLTLAEGAALASMLPNPHRFGPHQPAVLRRRASHVLDRCLEDRVASPEVIAAAQEELDRWLGPMDRKARPANPPTPPEDEAEAAAE